MSQGAEANLAILAGKFEVNERDLRELRLAFQAHVRLQTYLRSQLGRIPKGAPE